MPYFGLLAKIMINMKLQRAGTLLVVLKSETSIFEVLKRCGVRPAEHLTAVQVLPGARWDVTFKNAEIKERFLPVIMKETGVDVTSYSRPVKIVTVLHVPHEVDDNAVRFVLGPRNF